MIAGDNHLDGSAKSSELAAAALGPFDPIYMFQHWQPQKTVAKINATLSDPKTKELFAQISQNASGTTDNGVVSFDQHGNKITLYKNGAIRENDVNGDWFTLTPTADGKFVEHRYTKVWVPWRDGIVSDQVLGAAVVAFKYDAALPIFRLFLLNSAESRIKDAKELATFKSDMDSFERRAAQDQLKPTQIASTYFDLNRLLTSEAKQPTTPEQRRVLAEQILSQAASQKMIHQGRHPTCGPATVEIATYREHPESAAVVIAQVAIFGQFSLSSGGTVSVDAQPHGESHELPVRANSRSYASELFQVAAINVVLKKFEEQNPGVRLQYRQVEPQRANDDGERFGGTVDGRKIYGTQFYLWPEAQLIAYHELTGASDLNSIVVHGKFEGPRSPASADSVNLSNRFSKADSQLVAPQMIKVATEKELQDALNNSQSQSLVTVNADNPPFDNPSMNHDRRYKDTDEKGHVVLIRRDSSTAKPQAVMFNTMGDNSSTGEESRISIHDLFISALPRKAAIVAMQQDVAKKEAPLVEQVDLIRLRVEDGQLNHRAASEDLEQIFSHASERKPEEEKRLDRAITILQSEILDVVEHDPRISAKDKAILRETQRNIENPPQ